ncbi:MAG: recombinase RecQ, partial [Cryobacterium sp.]
DDDTAVPCGRCDTCTAPWYPADVEAGAAATAAHSLDRVGVAIEPRAQWPTGVGSLGVDVRGNIPVGQRLSTGRALARLTDLGWGGPLRDVFASGAVDAPASAAMLAACVRVLADWGWDERPAAIVSVPSRRHPLLVESVARALSEAGRLPWLGALDLAEGGPSGTPGGNSAFRLANVWGRFDVGSHLAEGLESLTGRPVLLIDDIADSRWTITLAGRLLRQQGASAVLPFTLALKS